MGIDAISRLKDVNNFRAAVVPSSCARIHKTTYFMREYAETDSVQIAGLDALIIFARSGES
jgi:hypothetical protein